MVRQEMASQVASFPELLVTEVAVDPVLVRMGKLHVSAEVRLDWKGLLAFSTRVDLVLFVFGQILIPSARVLDSKVGVQSVLCSVFCPTQRTTDTVPLPAVPFLLVTVQADDRSEALITDITGELLEVHVDPLDVRLQGIFARQLFVADAALGQVSKLLQVNHLDVVVQSVVHDRLKVAVFHVASVSLEGLCYHVVRRHLVLSHRTQLLALEVKT